MERVFLLSPAHSGGKRAAMLTRPGATFELARQVQIGAASLGDVFAFCSGLYFRGKLAYARHFAKPPRGAASVYVITSSRGLVLPELQIGAPELTEFSGVPIDSRERLFTESLRQSTAALAAAGSFQVALLGSVATGKYVDTLLPLFGERLCFPLEFAGRGDMSRGALMLRAVSSDRELEYGPISTGLRLPRQTKREVPVNARAAPATAKRHPRSE